MYISEPDLAQGLSLAYERRVTMEADAKEVQAHLESEPEQSLEDLMNQMKQLWKMKKTHIPSGQVFYNIYTSFCFYKNTIYMCKSFDFIQILSPNLLSYTKTQYAVIYLCFY